MRLIEACRILYPGKFVEAADTPITREQKIAALSEEGRWIDKEFTDFGDKKATRQDVQKHAREIAQGMIESGKCASTWNINNGSCEEFAMDLGEEIGGGEVWFLAPDLNSIVPSHWWYHHGGYNYDAETPDGVKNWKDLSVFQNFLEDDTTKNKIRLAGGRDKWLTLSQQRP